ncbi:VLRF1 family aeRF1-type release factor [Alkalihalobacillus sp. MEB130]|uniref:VLRF1 family aeRF1-type release factor n=1 Tax=Alkalihalobacillus sp. MEB130 TaxID=2976704 RepID=UPI0028DEFEF0|nr:VLRF1 family aeRF1-type release factor [Alkalihalobacillus sp. MEB130]MDT8862324.1 VLRF1 family aeRF1-type release factor [Alkalihalobacillus sp. MEB130]
MMIVEKELRELKKESCKHGYLTIYLRTDQTSNDQQRGEWKIRLKNGLKKLEEYIDASNEANIKAFKKVKKKASDAIYAIQTELPKSLVVFVSPQGDFFFRKLQVSVENEFYWERKPRVEQLENLMDQYPKEGIVFIQKEDAFLIETSLGEVNIERFYDLEIENDDWKQYDGIAASERMAKRASHRDKYNQRFEANQQRAYRNLANMIQKEAESKQWSTIYLLGEQGLTTEFQKQLLFPSVKKVNKNYKKFSSKEIIGQVLAS